MVNGEFGGGYEKTYGASPVGPNNSVFVGDYWTKAEIGTYTARVHLNYNRDGIEGNYNNNQLTSTYSIVATGSAVIIPTPTSTPTPIPTMTPTPTPTKAPTPTPTKPPTPTPTPAALYTWRGNVYVDRDQNCSYGSSVDIAYRGATLTITGAAQKSGVTNSSGYYTFTGLVAGSRYTLSLVVPNGYVVSPCNDHNRGPYTLTGNRSNNFFIIPQSSSQSDAPTPTPTKAPTPTPTKTPTPTPTISSGWGTR